MTAVVRLLPRAFALLPRTSARLTARRRRRLLVLALLAALLTGAYLLWFRDSSFVRVERVEVKGLATAPGAAGIATELEAAGKQMTTLHLDEAALRRIVADAPVVHSIRLVPDFPHGLTIEVTENRPVALVAGDAGRVPVAADGTLLEGVELSGSLPEVRTTTAIPSTGRLGSGPALDRVAVAGAAPPALLGTVGSITIEPERGYVAHLDGGPEIWLGDGRRLADKWNAAAAVIAEESSAGAAYVDVRVPDRAAAGGLGVSAQPQPDPADAAPVVPPEAAAAAAPEAAAPPVPETAPPVPEVAPETTAPAPETAPTEPQPSLEP